MFTRSKCPCYFCLGEKHVTPNSLFLCKKMFLKSVYAIQCPILGVVLHSSACTTKTGDKHRPYKPLWLLPGTLPFKVYMQYSVLSFSCHQNLA